MAGFLTVERHFEQAAEISLVLTVSPNDPGDEPADGYQTARAFYRSVGFTLAMDLPRLWPHDTAVLMVRPLP